jgi:hypothetical protein
MKKIVCVFFLVLFLVMNLGMANTPAAINHNSVPMSSQEMFHAVGGAIVSCGYAYEYICCCLDLWIIQFCSCVINPLIYL